MMNVLYTNLEEFGIQKTSKKYILINIIKEINCSIAIL